MGGKKTKIGILGATGYTGSELLRLLGNHKNAEIAYAPVREQKHPLTLAASQFVFDVIASTGIAGARQSLSVNQEDFENVKKCDVILAALPHVESLVKVLELVNIGKPVIDLSGDLRLRNPDIYEKYYGAKHLKPDILGTAVYGLPEINRDKIKNADLVANPGCYATAALLALFPLAKVKAIKGNPVIDAKSGISGAGKNPSPKNLFCEVNENFIPYSVGDHKHIPEIEQTLADAAGDTIDIIFTPHLLPVDRGILCTSYVEVKEDLRDEKKLHEFYADFYKNEPFVNVLGLCDYPDIKSVRGSNRCDIGIYFDKKTNKAVIFSSIDNLVKGAAGQAIQNMNLMFGFDEAEGLPVKGWLP